MDIPGVLVSVSNCRSYHANPVLPSIAADNVVRAGHTGTSATSEEKSMPAAGFIRPFEYSEWGGRDGESVTQLRGLFANMVPATRKV